MPEPITDESEAPVAQWEPPQVDAAALTVGQLVPCTVIEQLESGAYSVNIGASSPAVLPRNEVFLRPNRTAGSREIGRGFGVLPVGFSFQAQVTALADGKVNVSLARAQRTIAWTRCAQLADDDVTLAAKVLRFGPAGATLAVENLPAFLPWSHWALPASQRTPALYGTDLEVKFLEVNRVRSRLVVSHRRYRVDQAKDQLKPGAVVKGSVTSVRETGAIVKLPGGVDGLLHVSQVSEFYVRNVTEILGQGDDIYCIVIAVDSKDGAISLSTKRLEDSAGEMVKNATAVYRRIADRAECGELGCEPASLASSS